MGYQLAGEVLDRCPDLPYRQFRVLVALALDARDSTRQAMPGMDTITLRANCGARAARKALAALRDRNLLKVVSRSAPGRRAVYEILPMPGNGGTVAFPRTAERDRSPERGNVSAQRGNETPSTGERDRSAPKSSPKSLVLMAASPPHAQPLVGEWISGCAARPPSAVIGQVGKQVARMLADGTDASHIRDGLAAWQAKGLNPSALPSVVNEVMNGGGDIPRRWAENRAKYARWRERARALDAADAERGEQP
jgi:hypothetical protein